MNKTDLMEIKKLWKITGYTISGFSYCIFSTEDGVLKSDSTSFYSLTEDEVKKYLSLLTKGYSTAESCYNDTIDAPHDLKLCLSSLAGQPCPEDMLVALSEQIIKDYERPGYYALLMFTDRYDIPEKTSDKMKTGESDSVYEYCSILLCPLKPQKGGIAYNGTALVLENATPYLQNPLMGMIYPAFTDRERDDRAFVCAKANEERNLLSSMFSVDVPDKPKPSAKIKENVSIPADIAKPLDDGEYTSSSISYLTPSKDTSDDISERVSMSQMVSDDISRALDYMESRRADSSGPVPHKDM